MRIRNGFAVLMIVLLPGQTLAEGCHHDSGKQAMSCTEGMVWDETRGTCVLRPSS